MRSADDAALERLVSSLLDYAREAELDPSPLLLAALCCLEERLEGEDSVTEMLPVTAEVPEHYYPH